MAGKTVRVALIGFGNVGQGLVEIFRTRQQSLEQDNGFKAQVVAVYTAHRGALYHPDGLDPYRLLEAIHSGKLANYADQAGLVRDLSALDTIRKTNADCIIEASPTNFETAEPALNY